MTGTNPRFKEPPAHNPRIEVDPAVAGEIQYLDPLSATDRAVINGLAQMDRTPREILPDSTPFNQVLATFELFCGAMNSLEITGRKITPLIGRMMVLIRANPEIHVRLGYKTFNAFCKRHLTVIGYHRSSVYISMRLVELHPTLILSDWVKIGIDRMYLLSKFCRYGDSRYEEHLEAARTQNITEFRFWCERQGLLEAGDTKNVPVVFNATRSVDQALKKFVADPRVHEVVGSSNTGRIIESMIQECSGEWLQEQVKPLISGVSWRCDWCHSEGVVDLRKERTLDGINRMVRDAHCEADEDCDYVDQPGQLVIFLNRD